MECSQNDVINESIPEVNNITRSDSEINLDDVINNTKNEVDIFSDLLTAISESQAVMSLNTAITEETVEQSLNAHADPSLNTRISFSTASELSEVQESPDDPYYRTTSPLQVWRNDGGRITGFEMMCDEKKVKIVDSLECLTHHNDFRLEAVHFDTRLYLGIPYCEQDFEGFGFSELSDAEDKDEESDEDDVKTANLGPTPEEFENWLRDND